MCSQWQSMNDWPATLPMLIQHYCDNYTGRLICLFVCFLLLQEGTLKDLITMCFSCSCSWGYLPHEKRQPWWWLCIIKGYCGTTTTCSDLSFQVLDPIIKWSFSSSREELKVYTTFFILCCIGVHLSTQQAHHSLSIQYQTRLQLDFCHCAGCYT